MHAMTPNAPDTDPRLKKLKFRAWRRGFREADLILGPFADQRLADLAEPELDDFERLLDQPDQHLYAWIIEREATPAEFDTPVMDLIKRFRFSVHAARTDVGG